MIFQELVVQNFGPYYGQHTLDLSTTKDSPIILIGGLNGGGKTTLMDAIRLALYGQRAQCDRRRTLAYGDFLSQCVNAKVGSDDITQIELTLHHVIRLSGINKHATLCIKRSWTRQPKNGKDHLEIELDGWPNVTLTENWDEQIEDWFPLGISNLFLFDGEQVKELAEQAAPPSTVVNAIRSVLGLELADRLAADLNVLVSRKRAEYADSDEQQHLETLIHQLRQTEQDLAHESTHQVQIRQAIESAQTTVAHAEEQFFAGGGRITEQANSLQDQAQHLKVELQLQLQALRDLAASTLPLAMIQPLLQTAAIQGQKEHDQRKAAIARELVLDHDQRLLDLVNQLKLHHTQRKKIRQFLQHETDSLQQTASIDAWLNITADQVFQLTQLLQAQLPHEQQLAQIHIAQIQHLTAERDALNHKLAKAASPEDYERLKSAQEQAQFYLSELTLTLEIHKRRSDELERRKRNLQKELEQMSERAIADGNTNTLLQSAQDVQMTLTLFRNRLTQRKLNDLEQLVTQYFLLLLHKSSLVHRILINADTFQLDLYDTEGQRIPTHRLSAGEKQLLAIAFLWGLASLSRRQLPIAIDTPLSRLDSKHRQNLVERYFPQASHQVILLSTDTEIRDKEVTLLRQQEAIAKEYLLKYDSKQEKTEVKEGYFW